MTPEEAEKVCSETAADYRYLAVLEFMEGNYAEASTHYERSLQLEPTSVTGWRGLERCHTAMGNDEMVVMMKTLTQKQINYFRNQRAAAIWRRKMRELFNDKGMFK